MSTPVKYRRSGDISTRAIVRSDGTVHASAYEAAGGLGIADAPAARSIVACCNHKQSYLTAGGYKWMWLDEWLCKELGLEG